MSNDQFANIASGYNVSKERGLIKPAPICLENKVIDAEKGDQYTFKPFQKTCSSMELSKELIQLKQKFEPFLRDLAPTLDTLEKRIELETFLYSLNGGAEEVVKIPHYGGPIGKQTATYKTNFFMDNLNDQRAIIRLEGVDYIAHIYVNDQFVGSHEGFFAPFEMDITDIIQAGENHLKILVKNDYTMMGNSNIGPKVTGDKIYAATGLGWDDPKIGWHHCPAGMGIYNTVAIEIRNEAYITDLFVRNEKEVWIECQGTLLEPQEVVFEISLYGQNFEEVVFEHIKLVPSTLIEAGVGDTLTEAKLIASGELGAGKPLLLENGYNRYILPIDSKNLRIWSSDCPYLYQIQVKMVVDGQTVSQKKSQFGLRTFTQDNEAETKGMFFLNGEKIRLHGANTMGFEQQDVMKKDFDQLIEDILLAKLCNMNFLRLTQRPVQKEIYEYCDRLGMMIQTDLPLFGTIRINQYCEVLRQVEEMEKHIRSHPSCILVSYINEPFPNAGNMPHRMISRKELMNLFTAADSIVKLHNPDRVIKHVDGDYDPPTESMPDNHCYPMWYNGHGLAMGELHRGFWLEVKPNWYYGCGEFGAEGLEVPEVMKAYYPKEWLVEPFEPKHIIGAQTDNFHNFFYETPKTMEGWVEESQKHQAFATKIMTSAMRRNNHMVSFAIHLFIDAWPSGWMKTIMDCDRNPKLAYFTYKDCLSPVFASIRSDRWTYTSEEDIKLESYISNDLKAIEGEIIYTVEHEGEIIYSAKGTAHIKTCETVFQGYFHFKAPKVEDRTQIKVSMGLVNGQEVIHYTEEIYTVFPEVEKDVTLETINYESYSEKRDYYDQQIMNGLRVVFEPLKQGNYIICNKEIIVTTCGMSPLYFVSRDTGHLIVKDFEKKDFSYWYDDKNDRMMPLIYATYRAEGIEPILTSTNQSEKGYWQKEFACGEFAYGQGNVIINQVITENMERNPVCQLLINKLVQWKMKGGAFNGI